MAGLERWSRLDSETDRNTISVIIPTLNEEAHLPATLTQFDRSPGNWEIIVVDSGSSDRTLDIAGAAGCTVIEQAPAGRGAAMNAGAERATGDILLFLHADTLLPAGAHSMICSAFRRSEVAATGFRLKVDRDEWRYCLLTPIATLRYRAQRTIFGDQAIAVRRRDFERVGGYRETTLMEDVGLSKQLRKLGKLELLPAHVTTSARRFEDGGVFKTLIRMTLLQMAYALGVPATRLARWYRPVRSSAPERRSKSRRVELHALTLRDEHDHDVGLDSLLHGGPVLLIFLRWLG